MLIIVLGGGQLAIETQIPQARLPGNSTVALRPSLFQILFVLCQPPPF